jgi:uncharacterized protein YjbJ (UPF0337 family)
MNKDQVKGKAKDVVGKVQEKAGEMTGSEEHRRKGVDKQVEGQIQKEYGDVKETVKDKIDH